MAVITSEQEMECDQVEKENKKTGRSKCPGVRVIHGRIYDSDNGKTCHQCRQKTRDFAAECKNLKGNKQCTIKYCHKCLLNRYGEKAEEVALLDNWTCPKCKGICNCSFCMKKRGHKPTGILVRTAKENGFSSVSELLQIKGPENFAYDRNTKDSGASLTKPGSAKESTVASPRKPGKENSFDANSDSHSQKLSPVSNKKHKKVKRGKLQDVNSGDRDDDDTSLRESGRKKPRHTRENSTNKVNINGDVGSKSQTQSESILKEEGKQNKKVQGTVMERKSKKQHQDVSLKEVIKDTKAEYDKVKTEAGKMSMDVVVCLTANENRSISKNCKSKKQSGNILKVQNNENFEVAIVEGKFKEQFFKGEVIENIEVEYKKENAKRQVSRDDVDGVKYNINKNTFVCQGRQIEDVIPLPLGTCLSTVAGIQLPHEDAGHALQLFEFCAAFGEVLDLKKGQVEAVIREIIFGRRGRRSQSSLLVQFHIKLLSLILEDVGEESTVPSSANGRNSWLKALGRCVCNNKFMSEEFPSDCFDEGNERYDVLSSSQKFKLLNFLCDEALNTIDLRSWIDDQNAKFVEKEKEAKEKVLAAKDKGKLLKHKVQDEVAKAIIAKNGASFSVSEHEAIVSQIKREAAEAHAEMLSAMGMLPKRKQRSDAVRTDPIFVDVNGHAFWRLKGYTGESDILLQDLGNGNLVALEDKWFAYDAEQKQGVEKYISSLGTKRLRAQKVREIPSNEYAETSL